MKNSNKVLFGGIGFALLLTIVFMAIARINTKVWNPEECGKLVKSTKTITDSFERVELSDKIVGTLTQGDFKVDIEGPEESMNLLSHKVEDGVLKIYLKTGGGNPCPINVDIRCPQLSGLQIANGSEIRTTAVFETSNLDIEAMNGSSVNFELVSDRVSSSAMNSASIQFGGSIKELELTGRNSANFNAVNTEVSTAKVTLSNSAYAEVKADTIGYIDLSNSASLKYKGETVIGQSRINNSSSLEMIK